jgi:hypothetical protein
MGALSRVSEEHPLRLTQAGQALRAVGAGGQRKAPVPAKPFREKTAGARQAQPSFGMPKLTPFARKLSSLPVLVLMPSIAIAAFYQLFCAPADPVKLYPSGYKSPCL